MIFHAPKNYKNQFISTNKFKTDYSSDLKTLANVYLF